MPCSSSYTFIIIQYVVPSESDLIKSVPWCVTISYVENFLMKIMRLRSDCVRRVNVPIYASSTWVKLPIYLIPTVLCTYPKRPKNVTQYKWTTPVIGTRVYFRMRITAAVRQYEMGDLGCSTYRYTISIPIYNLYTREFCYCIIMWYVSATWLMVIGYSNGRRWPSNRRFERSVFKRDEKLCNDDYNNRLIAIYSCMHNFIRRGTYV